MSFLILHFIVKLYREKSLESDRGAEGKKKTKKHKSQTWAKEGPRDPFEMVTDHLCVWSFFFFNEKCEYIYLFNISSICSQLDSLSEEKQQEIQKALHLFSFGHGPPKNLQEAQRHTYRFWDTQPVPKIGMNNAQVNNINHVRVYKWLSFFFRWESDITWTSWVTKA